MREELVKRLEQLKVQYAAGQKSLADLEQKEANLHETLKRIREAIQALEEELAKPDQATTTRS